MVPCEKCGRIMWGLGCDPFPVILRDGRQFAPIAYGKELGDPPPKEGDFCTDCGVLPGMFHHRGCDCEECPHCCGQLIQCPDVDYPRSRLEELEEIA